MYTDHTRLLYLATRDAAEARAAGLRHGVVAEDGGVQAAGCDKPHKLDDPLTVLRLNGRPDTITSLHLGGRKLPALHPNVARCVNLEELWINDNRLVELRGLVPLQAAPMTERQTGCRRLKRLYANGNSIATLKDCDLRFIPHLEVLMLSDNRLSSMEDVARELRGLTSLRQLDLSGNPLTEEGGYRLYFIRHLPHIEVLDRRSVSTQERIEAARVYGGLAAAAASASGSRGGSSEVVRAVAFGASTRLPPVRGAASYSTVTAGGPRMPAADRRVEAQAQEVRARQDALIRKDADEARAAAEAVASRHAEFHSRWNAQSGSSKAVPFHHGVASSLYNGTSTRDGGSPLVPPPAQNYFRSVLAQHLEESGKSAAEATARRQGFLEALLTPTERDALRKAFGVPVPAADTQGILQQLLGLTADMAADLTILLERQARDSAEGRPVSLTTFGREITHQSVLDALAQFEPLIVLRQDAAYESAQAAVAKGDAATATALLRRIGVLQARGASPMRTSVGTLFSS